MKQNIITLLLISVLSLSACGQSPEDARKELGQMNISYSEGSFIESAANGDMMAVKLFLASGMDVNSENGLALVYAVQKGRTEIVETLLDAGADVNKRTPLIAALRQNQVEIVKILLDKGADINIENGIALRIAANSGRTDLVKLLLDKGADITLRTSEGETALMDAVREGHVEIVKLLLDKGANGADGGVLWVAIQNGRTELVNLLLDKGADANVKTQSNQTALMEAIRIGQPEIIKLLLDKGADANVKDQNNKTALIMALEIDGRYNKNKNDIIKTLLDQAKGIDVNVNNFYGTPALFLVESDIEIMKALINKGADVNARYDRFGVTALMKTVSSGNIDLVKFLIDKGADINAIDTYGNTALIQAVNSGNIEIVKFLLDKGADTNARGSDGYTALMRAIMSGNTNIVKLLLDKGADINLTGTYGDTALSRARPYPEIAQLLKNAVSHGMPHLPHQEVKTKVQQTVQIPSINSTTKTFSPSFDCAIASTNSEHLICSNANLAAVDVEMAKIYKKVFENTNDKKSLMRDQNQWRKNYRDVCKDVGCMLNVYAVRIKQLNEQQSK